jgi:hypothetical protein
VAQEDNGWGNSMQLLFVKAAPSAVTGITFDSEKAIRRIILACSGAKKALAEDRTSSLARSRQRSLHRSQRRDSQSQPQRLEHFEFRATELRNETAKLGCVARVQGESSFISRARPGWRNWQTQRT